ncbi:polysaccharide deacetylase family protein [Nocardioides panacihumi]|uniref:Polysaccharide deacetylase family protein n=1 Tax=Nocardioides panacihumi TaxID=400774 RepID=A0ABN2RHT3_9ACTN
MLYNLCFHGIGTPERPLEPGEADYWITPRTYADVLDLVVGRDDVRLSFDDGNRSDVAIGLPGLLERGLSAEFFVLAGRIDEPGSLSAADMRALAAAGMRIGSHGWDHVSWRDATDAGLEDELVAARRAIGEVVDRPVDTAACPLGLYDRRVLGALRRLGYTRVMTSDRAVARPDAWMQPRFSLRAGDDAAYVAELLRPPGRIPTWSANSRILAKSLR